MQLDSLGTSEGTGSAYPGSKVGMRLQKRVVAAHAFGPGGWGRGTLGTSMERLQGCKPPLLSALPSSTIVVFGVS